MKKFEKFLFFYSILAVTVFFISFGLMSPKPLNFISGVALLPIVFYFWMRLTSPQAVNAERWSIRFLFVILVLSSLGVFGYYLSASLEPTSSENILKGQLMEAQRKNEELVAKLNVTPEPVASELAKPDVQGENIADLLTEESPAPGSVHRITSKNGVNLIDVYQDTDITSKKVGNLESGVKYPYMEKANGWYKVVVTSTTSGWVSSAQVQEVY